MHPWHVRLATDGRHPMFPTEQALREAVRILVHTAGRDLALFCIVDDHIHAVLWCPREVLTWRTRSLCRVMRHRSAAPITPSWFTPVRSRQHLSNLVAYLLCQTGHHGLPGHPALWSGSCFQDLVGARVLRGHDSQLPTALPRLQRWEICRAVGLAEQDVQPLEIDRVRSLGAARILSASSAALGVGPDLEPRSRARFLVRVLTVRTGREAGLAREELSWVLGCSNRNIHRLEDVEIAEHLLRAVRIRLTLEQAVAAEQARKAARRAS